MEISVIIMTIKGGKTILHHIFQTVSHHSHVAVITCSLTVMQLPWNSDKMMMMMHVNFTVISFVMVATDWLKWISDDQQCLPRTPTRFYTFLPHTYAQWCIFTRWCVHPQNTCLQVQHTHSLSSSSSSLASVLRPQGRLTFHSGSVSILCDHSHAASSPLKVSVVVCQNSNKNTPCNAACVCLFVCGETEREKERGGKKNEVKFVCVAYMVFEQELPVKSNQFFRNLTQILYVCKH